MIMKELQMKTSPTKGISPTGEEREAKRQEIHSFLQKNGMDRVLAIKKFQAEGLSVAFIRKAMSKHENLVVTGKKKELVSKIQKFLLTKVESNEETQRLDERAVSSVFDHFVRKEGCKKKFIRSSLMYIAHKLKGKDKKEGARLMAIIKNLAKKTENLSREEKQEAMEQKLQEQVERRKKELRKKIIDFLSSKSIPWSKDITEETVVSIYRHFMDEGHGKWQIRSVLDEIDRKGKTGLRRVLKKALKKLNPSSPPKQLSPKSPLENKRQVSFSEETVENSNKSLRKVPPTPVIKTPNDKTFAFEKNKETENCLQDGQKDSSCQDTNEGKNEVKDKTPAKLNSTPKLSVVHVKNEASPRNDNQEDDSSPKSSDDEDDKDPFEQVLKKATKGTKVAERTPMKAILRKRGSTQVIASSDIVSKRVSWGKNEYKESDDLVKFTPQSVNDKFKRKKSIYLMSFDTPVSEKASSIAKDVKQEENDEEIPQLVPIQINGHEKQKLEKKASPKFKISPRVTRSLKKKKMAQNLMD